MILADIKLNQDHPLLHSHHKMIKLQQKLEEDLKKKSLMLQKAEVIEEVKIVMMIVKQEDNHPGQNKIISQ